MGKVPLPILKELEHQVEAKHFHAEFHYYLCQDFFLQCQHTLKSTLKKVKSQVKKGADPEKAAKHGYEEACEYLDLWNKTILIQHRALTCLSKTWSDFL